MKENRKMKKITVGIFSVLLLSMGISGNTEIFAITLQQEKQDIIQDLENIKEDVEINKKSKKNIEAAIKQLEKSLDKKLWKDDSTLNLKSGEKVLDADKKAIDNLTKVLKNKKELKHIKEQILKISQKIAEIDKNLVGNAINSVEETVMSEKGLKKLSKASDIFENAEEFLEEERYHIAVKKLGKSFDMIKKALKDPHFKKMEIVELEGVGDMNFDGIPDVYLKIIEPNKKNKPKQVEIKITGECVNGEIHNDAAMKIGFSTQAFLSTEFFSEEITATNKWFKKHDPNKKIDSVSFTNPGEYYTFPKSGDDLIQKNLENEKGSFEFSSTPISILGDQTGWEGEFEFDGRPGDYHLNVWFPLTEPTNQGDSCNFISSFSIDTTINP